MKAPKMDGISDLNRELKGLLKQRIAFAYTIDTLTAYVNGAAMPEGIDHQQIVKMRDAMAMRLGEIDKLLACVDEQAVELWSNLYNSL